MVGVVGSSPIVPTNFSSSKPLIIIGLLAIIGFEAVLWAALEKGKYKNSMKKRCFGPAVVSDANSISA